MAVVTRILHLSDTHVSATGPDEDGVDAVGSLERILHDARHVPNLDVVVISGDVADDGSAAGCMAVRERVAEFAHSRDIPQVYSTGNHDRRPGFVDALGTGHLEPDGVQVGKRLTSGTCMAVSSVGGLRIVTLDSLVPGETHGVLDPSQLTALAEVLDEPAAAGTVLVFHHPPIWSRALPFTRDIVLRNPDDLAAVMRGRDVRAVLTGHLHFPVNGVLAGVPVVVSPGIVTRIDTTAAPGLVRGVLGAGATVVDLDDDGVTTYVLQARDPHAGDEVYVYDPTTGAAASERDSS